MSKTWVIADPHFGHQGVCNFKQADGVVPHDKQPQNSRAIATFLCGRADNDC